MFKTNESNLIFIFIKKNHISHDNWLCMHFQECQLEIYVHECTHQRHIYQLRYTE